MSTDEIYVIFISLSNVNMGILKMKSELKYQNCQLHSIYLNITFFNVNIIVVIAVIGIIEVWV